MRLAINKLLAFFHLNNQEKIIAILCTCNLFLTSIFFKLLPLEKLILVTIFLSKKKFLKNQKNVSYKRIYYIHDKCFIYFFNSSCLMNCISAKIILSFYGFEVRVQNGVRLEKNDLKGHAWIVINNNEILGKKEKVDQYSESFSF